MCAWGARRHIRLRAPRNDRRASDKCHRVTAFPSPIPTPSGKRSFPQPHTKYCGMPFTPKPPGSSPLVDEHRKGTFVCDGCGQKLFDSDTKFESGTGWPSFYKCLKDSVIERKDDSLGEERTEILCARCGGHLGHVFDDGPL